MRTWLKIWSLPLGFLIVWFTLSYNDWNFGTRIFSRETHDQFLLLYATMLGVEVSELAGLLKKAIIFDLTVVVTVVYAFKKRRIIWAWLTKKLGPVFARS